MSNSIIIFLIAGLVVAIGLLAYGVVVGSRFGFRSGRKSQQPEIATLQDKIRTLTDENNRTLSKSQEVARQREENERRGKELDERERQISETENQQREADRALKSRARKLREERDEMEQKEADSVVELNLEQQRAQRAREQAESVTKYCTQSARSAVPVYIGDAAAKRECAGVYVVSREGAVKIGITDDFSRRFKELHAQCKSVGIVNLYPEALVPIDEGRRQVEERVHFYLKDKQTAGEWFAVSPDMAVSRVINEAWRVKDDNARHRELRSRTDKIAIDTPEQAALQNFAGITPLHLAAARNDVADIKRLLRLPSSVNRIGKEDNQDYTPIDWAVGCDSTDALAEFIKHGRLPDCNRLTRLAALKGAHESIAALIQLGADVNAANGCGDTPLHYAHTSEVVETLVKNGAHINARNKDSATSLCIAAARLSHLLDRANTETAPDREASKLRQVVISLMEHGADVINLAEKSILSVIGEGTTLMHFAAQWNDVDLIEKLAAHDEDLLEIMGHNGWTPMHTAAGWNNAEAINTLVRLGAFVDPRTNREEKTPLHVTVEDERMEAAEALLANGADVNAYSVSGTPLDYCWEQYGFHDVDDHDEDDPGYRIIKIFTEHGGSLG